MSNVIQHSLSTIPHADRRSADVLGLAESLFGVRAYRPLQAEAIEAALAGRDSLVVMPTGGGKSLCYQLPALVNVGPTVVVSPLIALMKDQVDRLQARGIPARFLNSGQHPTEQEQIEKEAVEGKYRLLYVSPERCTSPGFITTLLKCNPAAFVIDEAHCITQWGHDFRPAYGSLGNLRKLFPKAPIHAFTATARPTVRGKIVEALGLRDPVVLVGDFDRPNLTLRVVERDWTFVGRLLSAEPRGHGIIYCMTRAETSALAEELDAEGCCAMAYHAGMDDDARRSVQDWFMKEDGPDKIVVATIAFGMGIDHPNVRFVYHASMPSSMEVYHQEIGRAGRDGRPAECVIFYARNDYDRWCELLEVDRAAIAEYGRTHGLGGEHPDFPKRHALDCMASYCDSKSPRCRHRQITDYFDQPYARDNCGACEVCMDQSRDREGADDATQASGGDEAAPRNTTVTTEVRASKIGDLSWPSSTH